MKSEHQHRIQFIRISKGAKYLPFFGSNLPKKGIFGPKAKKVNIPIELNTKY